MGFALAIILVIGFLWFLFAFSKRDETRECEVHEKQETDYFRDFREPDNRWRR